MCGVNDIADAVAMRELFIKTYARRIAVYSVRYAVSLSSTASVVTCFSFHFIFIQ